MIRINLLPEERQRKERTPIPRFLAMNAAIIICLLLLIWNAYLFMNIKRLTTEHTAQKESLSDLLKQVAPYDQMLVEEQKLNEWNTAAVHIKETRSFFWWEKIDEIWDVIHNARDVWITSLQALDGPPPGFRGGGTAKVDAAISMNCFAAGASSNRMTSFRIALKNHPKLKETFNLGLNEPPILQVVAQPDYKEEFAVKFDIELSRGTK